MASTTHLYSTGDVVICELLNGVNGAQSCSIVKQMPPLGTQLQYRVKIGDEKFERVVQEGQLSRLHVAA
jgi:hypothetical protein